MSAYLTSAIDHVFPYPGQDILIQDSIGSDVKHPPYKFCNILNVWSSETQPTLLWSYYLKITIGKEEKTKICNC